MAVTNLHVSFDCGVIVRGCGGTYLEEFGELLRALLAERNTFEPDTSYLKFCRFSQEAAAVGAALVQIETFLESI